MYRVIENGTGLVVSGLYKSLKQARRRADKLDLIYGAIHYHVEELQPVPFVTVSAETAYGKTVPLSFGIRVF